MIMMTIDNSDGFILHFQDISHGGIWGSEKRDENHRSLGCLSRESQHYRRPRSIIDARPNISNYYFTKTFAHLYEGDWLRYLFYISLPLLFRHLKSTVVITIEPDSCIPDISLKRTKLCVLSEGVCETHVTDAYIGNSKLEKKYRETRMQSQFCSCDQVALASP